MPTLSLAEAWEIFKRDQFPVLAVQSRRCYLSAMNRALQYLPERPTAADVATWHRVTMPAKWSVVYANLCLAVLQSVVRRVSLTTGDVELARAVLCELPLREPVRAPRCPPSDAFDRALRVARNPAESAWLGLCFLGGLRKGELLGLKPDDWHNGLWVMRVLRQRESDTRKNRKPHSVRIQDASLARAIDWTIANRDVIKPRCGRHKGKSDGFLFPWAEKYVDGLLERIREGFGADVDRYMPHGVAWHAGRHWGASTMAAMGKNPVEIQQWLGDSSPEIAMSYVSMVRGATDAIALPANANLCEWGETAPARRSSGGQVLNSSSDSTLGNGFQVEFRDNKERDTCHDNQTLLYLTKRAI